VKRTPPELLISYWSAPGRALLVLGNVGESTVEATVEPDWQQLGLEPGKFQAVDAESGDAVAVDAGGGRGFRVEVARHDLRLILAGSPELVRIKPEPLGAALPGPAEPLAEFCDRFTGPELAPVWQKDCHEGNSGVSFSDGRLCLQGAHYGYTHVRREFGLDNVSVQCLILRQPSGCADEAGGSLFLYWQNGAYVQAAVGLNNGKFLYLVSGQARRDGSAITRQAAPGWFPHCANWVRIALRPDTIVCSGSADGKTWTQDVEFKRDPAHAGPPQFLMVGNGQPGARPHLDNVVSAHYQPQSVGPYPVTFFSGLIVGRE
jgi:hypothetical protein